VSEAPPAAAPGGRAPGALLHSAIYRGSVRHRRYAPRAHAFHYRLFQLYLDLAELDRAFEDRWLWSVNRRNVAEFRRSDFLGDPHVPLDVAVRERIRAQTGRVVDGPIRLLAHLRYFGYCFNPVAFYYCYAPDGTTLDTIVAEITNTPWNERHAYVLPLADAERHGAAHEWGFAKAFHVSPFLPLDRDYRWRFTVPGESIRVHMDVLKAGEPEFDATLALERLPLTGPNLARCLAAHPLMTAKVVGAIHWQALLIWLKRNPVYDHPNKLGKPP
jgi:hypothetical protein